MRRRAVATCLALAVASGIAWAAAKAGEAGRCTTTTYCPRCSGGVCADGSKPRKGNCWPGVGSYR